MEILNTMDYSVFKILKMNRPTDLRKVSRFVEEMKKRPHLPLVCPVIVTTQMEILDGQHRFLACKMLGTPVYYVTHPLLSYEDMIILK